MTAKHDRPTFTEKVKATFDLFLLFGRGIKPFEKEGTFRDAMMSLWIVVLATPLNYVSSYLYQPEGLENAPYRTVAIITTGFGILSTVIGIAVSYLFAVVMDRKDRFWLWFQVGNWMTIPATILGIPLIAVAASGHYPRADMDHVLSLFLYYGMIVNGCVTFRSLKIGWEMAGFYACMSIFIGQQIYNLMFWLNGYSAP